MATGLGGIATCYIGRPLQGRCPNSLPTASRLVRFALSLACGYMMGRPCGGELSGERGVDVLLE
ncbi:hypothetical protein [Prevotella sp. kh1p2]|uniref:hypothetical protein n=1 Tax=Prevotella sp. kh1p2 TaxID=1761883 RepID=UPI00115FE9F7|nr:hypothetical protein [Prevotella sp. kh1p2]